MTSASKPLAKQNVLKAMREETTALTSKTLALKNMSGKQEVAKAKIMLTSRENFRYDKLKFGGRTFRATESHQSSQPLSVNFHAPNQPEAEVSAQPVIHPTVSPIPQAPDASPSSSNTRNRPKVPLQSVAGTTNVREGMEANVAPVSQDHQVVIDTEAEEDRGQGDDVDDDTELELSREKKLDGFLVLGNSWNIVRIGKF